MGGSYTEEGGVKHCIWEKRFERRVRVWNWISWDAYWMPVNASKEPFPQSWQTIDLIGNLNGSWHEAPGDTTTRDGYVLGVRIAGSCQVQLLFSLLGFPEPGLF